MAGHAPAEHGGETRPCVRTRPRSGCKCPCQAP